jgi:hypothetical protein
MEHCRKGATTTAMKITFFLDNNQYLETEPDKLQLMHVAPDQAAIGVNVNVPKLDDEGKPILDEDKQPILEPRFASLVSYAVNLKVVKVKEKKSKASA